MAAKKPKTNRGEPDFDRAQKDISKRLQGQKLSAAERAEFARFYRFENEYIDRVDLQEGAARAKRASRARQGRINVTKSKTATPKKTPQPKGMASPPRTGPSSGGGGQSSRYSRLTGGGLNKHGR